MKNILALLVGIDKSLGAPPLRGCTNDAMLMATVLEKQGGVPRENLRTLLDERATRAAIMAELSRIEREAGPNTTIFFYFSGWGARVPQDARAAARIVTPFGTTEASPSGAEYDSALLPYDWRKEEPSLSLRYDALRTWLSSLPTRNVTVVLDAPYSGTLLGSGSRPGTVYVGASRAEEICFEFYTEDNVVHGGLTYFLSQALLRAEPGATYRQIFERVSEQVVSRLPYQHPQLEGDADRAVFEGKSGAGSNVVRVASREPDQTIKLDIGAAAGITTQSWWAIHPDKPTDDLPSDTKLGMVEITEVRVSDATAKILSEIRHGAIDRGARAVEEQHHYGEMRLRVAVTGTDTQAVDNLETMLRDVKLLTVVEPDARCDVLVRHGAEGWLIEDDARTPEDHATSQPRPIFPPSGEDEPYEVRLNLEKLSRYRNVLSLVNPNRQSPLAGKVDLTIKRKTPEGNWIVVEADPKLGVPVLHEGDRIKLEVRNDYDTGLFVSILDFGLAKTISSVLRSTQSGQPIGPGRTLSVFSDGAPLHFPRNVMGSSGIETLKIFAAPYPMDIGAMLLQEGTRGLSMHRQGGSTELWQLLDMALTGRGARERRPVNLPPSQEWTTVQRTFELRRGAR